LLCEQQLLEERQRYKKQLHDTLNTIATNAQTTSPSNPKPRVFISYAKPTPENKSEEEWLPPFLQQLRIHLRMAGITALLDIVDNKTGNPIQFMENIKTIRSRLINLHQFT
jgi:hypothetical protein